MIKVDEVIKFIENDINIQLYDFQKKFIENLVIGKTTRMPRATGTTMLIDGYCNYLRCIFDNGRKVSSSHKAYTSFKNPELEQWDDNVYLEDVLVEMPQLLNTNYLEKHKSENIDSFKREYNPRDES